MRTGFTLGGLEGLAFALALVVFVSVEQQVQPWHHLVDRRQLAGQTRFAARSLFARSARLSLRPRFAAWALWSGFTRLALWSRFAALTFRAGPARMALWSRRSAPADCIVCHWRCS
jgi:hypothetical protein